MATAAGSPLKKAIYFGADDNGSGSTAVMEMARRFSAIKNRQGRTMVFMTFSGEELGMIGSRYYADHPLLPLADTAAMLNLDMVGRLSKDAASGKDKLLVEGSTTSKTFDPLLDKLNKTYDFKFQKTGVINHSDHASFYTKKIPAMFFWNGDHPDYHRPTDTPDKINIPGMLKIIDMSEEVLVYLTTIEKRPDYVAGQTGGGRGGATPTPTPNRPRLGVTPKYPEDEAGILLEDVAKDGAAEKAGVKGGDRIVELAGKPVKTLTELLAVIDTQKSGDTVEIVVVRDGKKMKLKLKLE